MEWSVARMLGANHKTLQTWEAAHKLDEEGAARLTLIFLLYLY